MTDVKTKLMLLGPLPQLLSLGEVLDTFWEGFCAERLEKRLFDDMHRKEHHGIYLLTSYLTSRGMNYNEDRIEEWGIRNMDTYLNTVENAVRSSFSTCKSKLFLSRFVLLCDRVVEVMHFLMHSRANTFLQKLNNFIWNVVYMSPLLSTRKAVQDKIELSVHAIVFKELVGEAILKKKD
eukprot:1840585-Pleurochrysis_carterae.AAC.1